MMTHEKFEALLSDYADGIMPVGQMRAFSEHLSSCARCTALADAFTSAVAELHSFPRLEVPEGFVLKVLEMTSRRPAAWEALWGWLGLPRVSLSPTAAGALLSMLLVFLAGTSDGRRVAREVSMVTHQTYSNAVRLYYRSSDLPETAAEVGKRIPGQVEGTVDWIRQRLARPPEGTPRMKDSGVKQNSSLRPPANLAV